MTNISIPGAASVRVVTTDGAAATLTEDLEAPGVNGPVAFDTETPGLDIESYESPVRLLQLAWRRGGDTHAAVLVAEGVSRRAACAVLAAAAAHGLVAHNAAIDLRAVRAQWGVDLADDLVADTLHLAHAIDPRPRVEGGVGLGLKELAERVDPAFAEPEVALKAAIRERRGWTLSNAWARFETTDPVYLRYAAADPVMTLAVLDMALPVLRARYRYGSPEEAPFFADDLECLRVFARAASRGMRLDPAHVEWLFGELAGERADAEARAALMGVGNVNAPAQVAAGLRARGAVLSERTPTGAPRVDKRVLEELAEGGEDLAVEVLRAKRAAKWSAAFVEPLRGRGRLHPHVSVVRARTGRMAVSDPPMQQLPSSEWRVRSQVVAAPGHVLVSADYSQLELRLLAALADVAVMREAILAGRDLLDMVAERLYGPGFSKAQRKVAKTVAYGKVYGGGAVGLSRQSGIPRETVAGTIRMFDREFPEVAAFQRRLERWAARQDYPHVMTWGGRRLPVDQQRLYAATNYTVQGSARDVFGAAVRRLREAGLAGLVVLPIHDEVLFEVPEDPVTLVGVLRAIGEAMGDVVRGVPLVAEADVVGYRWGEAYGGPVEYRGPRTVGEFEAVGL